MILPRQTDTCHEDMGSDPCGKPAVTTRLDPEYGMPYPVCEEHDRPSAPLGFESQESQA
jgi:hypothetical protein